jgi:hypothetical protein
MSLHLERLGPKFLTLHGASLSSFCLHACRLLYWLLFVCVSLQRLLLILTLSRIAREQDHLHL